MKWFIICLLFFFSNQFISQNWTQISDFPSYERDDGVAFVVNNKAYCGTGLSPWWSELRDFYIFDMATENWDTISSMPLGTERQYACGFSYLDKGFVFGGSSANGYKNDIWEYNSTTNTWLEKSTLPSNGRAGSASFVIDSVAYIIGGKIIADSIIDEVWAYDMKNDSWQQKNNFPAGGRWRGSATSYNGKGYLLFGLDENGTYTNQLYEYSPITDSWVMISLFPESGRVYTSLATINDQLLLIGGIDSISNYYNSMWDYNIITSTWSELDSIPSTGRKGGLCFNSNYTLYYTTGINENSVRLKETWKIFSPTSINDNVSFRDIRLYPNPTNGVINFLLDLQQYNSFTLTIYNCVGKLVLNKTLSLPSINLTQLENGIYFMNLLVGNEIYKMKFIKK